MKFLLLSKETRFLLFRLFGKGTVGAVVVDKSGRVAVATSTGGLTGKAPGRIGDTPLPGEKPEQGTRLC